MKSNSTLPLIDALNVFVTPSIIAFGVPGNLITALVFFQTGLRKHSASFYLGSLAIADAGYLLSLLITVLEFHSEINVYNENGWCQCINYIASVLSNWSAWLIVAFTIERYIALTYPLKRPIWCTVSKAKRITGALLVAACLANLYILLVSGINKFDECTTKKEFIKLSNFFNYIDSILTCVVPSMVIVVLNSLIANTVWKYKDNFPLDNCEDTSLSVSNRSFEKKRKMQNRRVGSSLSKRSYKHAEVQLRERRTIMARSQRNITKLILITSTVFLVLNMPSYIMRGIMFTYLLIGISNPPELIYTQRIANILYQSNFSVNFLLYAMCGMTFRKALKEFLKQCIKAFNKLWKLNCLK